MEKKKDEFREFLKEQYSKTRTPQPLPEVEEEVMEWIQGTATAMVGFALIGFLVHLFYPSVLTFSWRYLVFQFVLAVFLMNRHPIARWVKLVESFVIAFSFTWMAFFPAAVLEMTGHNNLASRISCLVYAGFHALVFVVLVLPKVRKAFPPLFPSLSQRGKEPILLSSKERKWTIFGVVAIAVGMMVASGLNVLFDTWLIKHGILPANGKVGFIFICLAALGLLFLWNPGRIFVLIICLMMLLGDLLSLMILFAG